MANRYDVAAPIEYVSQYVPIPFQELFTLAKYNADETKAAQKELNDYVLTLTPEVKEEQGISFTKKFKGQA